MKRAVSILILMASPIFAQANFDGAPVCPVALPAPCGAVGDPEGISWNGASLPLFPGRVAAKSATAELGFPVSGPQHATMACNSPGGGVPVPVGGPLVRPAPALANELCIPIPPGSTYVRFFWDYYNAEGLGSGFNDGTSIDIVSAAGALILPLAYADNSSILTGAAGVDCNGNFGGEVAPAGPNYFATHLPPLPAGAYLSVVAWNGGDNSVSGHVNLDEVWFGGAPTATTFERPGASCTWVFPTPIGTGGDPEGVSHNASDVATVANTPNGVGFPIGGCGGYLRVKTNGPVASPAGGPVPRPIAAAANEVAVALPAGTRDISFCWDFYTQKVSSGAFNDGMSIDIVDAGGALLVPLVYADTFSPAGPIADAGACGFAGPGRFERAPAGPNYFRICFPPVPAGAYLSIVVWNGGDDSFDGVGAVDNIVTGGPTIDYNPPGGPGSGTLSLQNVGFAPGDFYFTFATLNGAGYPNGWFYGISPNFGEILGAVSSMSPPFVGTLNACGSSCWEIGFVPAGITFYIVTLTIEMGSGNFREASAPRVYTTL